jgi:Ca-activated chloride channel family protein
VTKIRSWSRGLGVTIALAIILLIVPGGHAQVQVAAARNGQDTGSYRFSVDVDLVVLPVTVRDRQGQHVSDLHEGDFKVYEDRVPQRIRLFQHEDLPVTAGLLVDHSGSMRPKMAEVVAGARAFVRSSNPEDQMFVVNFNETVSLGLPDATGFTANADELENAIWRAPAAGETALYDAIVKALGQFEDHGRDKKVLVIISDGADNASTHSLARVLQMAERSSVIIYTVGLFAPYDDDANPKVLNRLAQATGGEAFFPGQPSAVAEICERIARDIRNQYTIGYVSTNAKRDGVHRSVRVTVEAPGHGKLFVRTRAGYIPAGSPSTVKRGDAK